MTKHVSSELPDDLYQRLCSRFVDRYANQVILIYTIGEDGWPHPAVLSYFEVAAKDRNNIRLATYQTSNTTENMRRRGTVTLSIFDERVIYHIKGTASELHHQMKSAPHNSILNVTVEQVLTDQADPSLEGAAYIASGITYVDHSHATGRATRNEILRELLD